MTMAEYERQSKNPKAAIAALNELVQLRRMAEDWRLMGVNALDMNRPDLALPAYERALSIRPYRSMIHVGLAEVFSRMGDPVQEKDHTDKANWLMEHRQQ
jgi:cytochrome c-type biogenesis protein CcmH/NrfG